MHWCFVLFYYLLTQKIHSPGSCNSGVKTPYNTFAKGVSIA